MKWRILTGGLTAALVLFLAGCDTCCRKTVPIRSGSCPCPPGGGVVVPPPPNVSGFQGVKYEK
jgi:hypothetical protein